MTTTITKPKGSGVGARKTKTVQVAPTRRLPATTQKVNVSLDLSVLAWLRAVARLEGKSLSAKITDALERLRRDQARERVIASLGDATRLTDEQRAHLDAAWD